MSSQNIKIDIPDELQQICKDMAKVARKHGLYKFNGVFRPNTGWAGDVSFTWEAGRHGEDSDSIRISSSFHVHTTVGGTKK